MTTLAVHSSKSTPRLTSPAEGQAQHIVQKGDTLQSVARSAGVSVDALRAANPTFQKRLDSTSLPVGATLQLPQAPAAPPGPSSTSPEPALAARVPADATTQSASRAKAAQNERSLRVQLDEKSSLSPATPSWEDVRAGRAVMGRGEQGPMVRALQERLAEHGHPVRATGKFGPTTESKVRDFQTAQKLPTTGVVDQTTLAALEQKPALPSVDTNHPHLRALAQGPLRGARTGLCVTATLDNMQRNGVPQPAATGNDVGNNPRGGMVQLMRSFGWKSLPLPGSKPETIKSPYGTVQANVVPAADYERLARAGQIPSGAIVFQTRHPTWNGTSPGSRGYDMGIARNGGRTLFNYADMKGPMVYSGTQSVVVLVPGAALRP